MVLVPATVVGDEDDSEEESLDIGDFELQQDGDVVASVDDGEWDDKLPEIQDPPMDRYGGFVAVDLDAVAVDEDGNEIDLGEDSAYELGVEPQDETAEKLLSIEEHGDSVVLDGEGHGTADVVFQIHGADGVEYETPVASVDVDVPPGVNFLAETNVDHDHAAFHGEVDQRHAVDAGDALGEGPVLEEDHLYWNVTYEGSAGYVTFDTEPHFYDGPFVFYVANGDVEPVNADVIEREEVGEIEGAGNVYETDTIEEYIKVETPESGEIEFRISEDLEADGTTAENDFAGIVADDEPLPVSATGLTDAEGELIDDGTVTVELIRDGTVLTSTTDVSVEDGEIEEASIDTEAIDPEVDPGPASVEVAGVEATTTDHVHLVHEARTLEEGFNQQSIPQPATVHTEAVDSIEQWDTETESYVGLGANYDEGDVIDSPEALHRGLYVDADSDARIGYQFETEQELTPGDVRLENGWHLASSNFAVGAEAGTRTLENDLVNIDVGGDGITAFDESQSEQIGSDSTVDAFDTYWVYVDEPERNDRAIVVPNYDGADRSDILQEAE